ncbi:hypothetical protein JTB14_005733 [Gonioctena quinquepunctata]|nr:hypothetical protein JTB14_005733 [Gonioctena quinquepunctata]
MYIIFIIQAWIEVTTQFNAEGRSQQARSMEQLKEYENSKTKARKYAADNKKYLQAIGSGLSHDPQWNPVVEAISSDMNEKTVIGSQFPNDSNAVDIPADEVMNIEVFNQESEYEEVLNHI